MTSTGHVRVYHRDEGWGVIDGPDVPGGCWVHFSVIAAGGYWSLTAGHPVVFRFEAADQDGFGFRAVKVWTGGPEQPDDDAGRQDPGGGYTSTLTLTFDPAPDTVTP
jgi:CspA family cold shock protein